MASLGRSALERSTFRIADRITLLHSTEDIYPGKQIELLKSAVIESFSELYDKAKKKNKIVSFVKRQLKSDSPKTRKVAREYYRWNNIIKRNAKILSTVKSWRAALPAGANYTFRKYYKRDFCF